MTWHDDESHAVGQYDPLVSRDVYAARLRVDDTGGHNGGLGAEATARDYGRRSGVRICWAVGCNCRPTIRADVPAISGHASSSSASDPSSPTAAPSSGTSTPTVRRRLSRISRATAWTSARVTR